MKSVTLKAPAKLNLTLDITGKRADGYHLMKMVMQTVDLFDTVKVQKNGIGEIRVFTDENIPCGQDNTAFRAAEEFAAYTGINSGFDIKISKNIPSGAGMGGASSDAADTLVALNALCDTGLSREKLCELGLRVGADVPFCLVGGTALTEGIGEMITPLSPLENLFFAVVKPVESMLTREAFGLFDKADASGLITSRPDHEKMLRYIKSGTVGKIPEYLCNVFESVVFSEKIRAIKSALLESGALGASMTGSGSAVFGIFDSLKGAWLAAETLLPLGKTFALKPLDHGAGKSSVKFE